MSCRHCLNRREFIAIGAGGAALAALSACGDGSVSGVGSVSAPTASRVVVTVGAFPGLATVGQLVKVGDAHAAKRTGASSFDAYSMICTHQGCLTSITSNQQFSCPCHGSQFASDGSVLQGPAVKSLPKLTASYNPATDALTIT